MEDALTVLSVISTTVTGVLGLLLGLLDRVLDPIDKKAEVLVGDIDDLDDRNTGVVLRAIAETAAWGSDLAAAIQLVRDTYNKNLTRIDRMRISIREFESCKVLFHIWLIASTGAVGATSAILILNSYQLLQWEWAILSGMFFFSSLSLAMSSYCRMRDLRKNYSNWAKSVQDSLSKTAVAEFVSQIRRAEGESR